MSIMSRHHQVDQVEGDNGISRLKRNTKTNTDVRIFPFFTADLQVLGGEGGFLMV